MSTLPVAQLKHVFGLRGGVVGGIAFQDEQTLVYPAGSNIVLYNVEQKVQRFIAGSEKSQMVTAMAITPNRRYIAIAEKGEKSATITIYDVHTLKRKKVLSAADLGISEFVSLAFSPDSKYLASQGGKPEWTLMYWMWEKSKVMASVKTSNPQSNAPVSQVAFNPQDNTVVSVVGQGTLKVFRFTEGNLKLLHNPKNEQHNYLSHAWVSDERLVAGTEQGIWQLFENGELKFEQNASATNATRESIDPGSAIGSDATAAQSSRAITSIAAYSKGFAMALGRGLVNVYDRTEDKSYFRKSREIKIPSDQYSADPSRAEQQLITHMLFSPSEETLSLVTDRSQIYALALSTADLAKGGDTLYFERLAQSFHSASVTGLDVCIRKPLIATCSADRSVRIWNYETCNLELYKEFAEEAYSIALHPSGLYVLVGFSDKLRLMNLLIDDIRSFKEFTVRGCRECSFSNGGHLFAAVHSNVIQVYSTTGFENVANLKGHNGKIRSVVWSADDSKLVSCGMDGAVYEWEPLTGKRVGESVLKTCNYTSVTLLPDAKSVLAVGTDRTLKEISNSTILREVPAGPDVTLASVSMSHSGRMLFAGTATGLLRAVKFPLTVPGEWNEYVAHATAITKMKITYNDELLVSVSEDATIMVWKVSDKEGRGLKRDREVAWAEEILITKSDLEEKNVMMSDLKTRVEELKMENEYQLRLKDMNYNEKIKELTEKFIQEMESLKTKNQVLKTEKDKSEAKHEEELQELFQKHGKEMQDLETSNNAKLMLEYEKYQELQGKSQKMQEDYERQLQEMEEAKERALQELTEFYELRLKERAADLDKAHDQSRTADREHEEGRRQIEEDADREILDLKNTYERRLREEREANMRLKGEAGIMNKKVSSLQREIEEKEELNKKVQTDNQKLQGIIKNLEKDIQGLKKEIQERDEAIQEKEKRIYELKKKNQELEKFKFVLDYKIKELKKQIEPRENEIKQMKEQIQEMESELERFHKQNTTLELTIAESRQRLKATERELAEARQRAHDVESRVRRFQTDLHNCVGYIQDPKMLKDSIVALYRKHAAQDTAAEAGLDADIQREYARQREHLERSVASLRKKLAKDSEIHRLEVVRIMQENVTLIKEINELRRELKQARTRINDLEAALGLHRKGAGSGTSGVPAIAAAGLTGAALEQLELLLGASTQPTSANRPQLERTIDEQERIIEMQRIEIKKLRDQLNSAPPAPGTGGTLLPPLSGSPVHSMQPLDSLV